MRYDIIDLPACCVRGAAAEAVHPERAAAERLGERCAVLRQQARHWFGHTYLRRIPVPPRPDGRSRSRLERARRRLLPDIGVSPGPAGQQLPGEFQQGIAARLPPGGAT